MAKLAEGAEGGHEFDSAADGSMQQAVAGLKGVAALEEACEVQPEMETLAARTAAELRQKRAKLRELQGPEDL